MPVVHAELSRPRAINRYAEAFACQRLCKGISAARDCTKKLLRINRIDKWKWLESTRPSKGGDRRQRYRVKLKPNVELPAQVLNDPGY
jgi:hypothetical protein